MPYMQPAMRDGAKRERIGGYVPGTGKPGVQWGGDRH